MKLVLISDTHGKHRRVNIPDADILVHAGDFTMVGELDVVADFNRWLGELPYKHKIVIAGNHDLSFERAPELVVPMLTNAIYLKNSGVEVEGLRFWGSPYTPFFNSDFWVFHIKHQTSMYEHWRQIPEGLDVLITHGPPNRVLDRTMEGEYAGDPSLLSRLSDMRTRPKIHVFGHIHESYGHRTAYGSEVYNASVVDRAYAVTNQPFVVEV